MLKNYNRVFVTGGLGFIGSAVCRKLIEEYDVQVLNVDVATYASTMEATSSISGNENYKYARVDICDYGAILQLLNEFKADAIIHLAAESHVDRSISDASEFIRTNVVGTVQLLNAALSYWSKLNCEPAKKFRFLHVSTDEVFGDLALHEPAFTESSPYQPSSPYSASKASSDHFVRSWYRTYGLPILLTNCSNNYGPYQFPEKLIPVIIDKAINRQPIPIYGTGNNVRDWIYVDDHVDGLLTVLDNGVVGQSYNLGGESERTNLAVATSICDLLDKLYCRSCATPYGEQITFVPDRPGHDRRYAIDNSKVRKQLDWYPKYSFETGLARTVKWYLDNMPWWKTLKRG